MIKNIQIKKFPLDKPGPARYTLCQKVRFRAGCDSPLAVRKLLSLPERAKGTKNVQTACNDNERSPSPRPPFVGADPVRFRDQRYSPDVRNGRQIVVYAPCCSVFVAAGRFSVCPSRSKIRNCFHEQGVPNDKDAQTVCNAYGNSFCDMKRAFGTFLQGLLPGKES